MKNVEFIEIAWTLMILCGTYPVFANESARIGEYISIKKEQVNHGAQFVAAGYVVADLFILLTWAACLMVGILAMFLPPDDDPATAIGLTTAWILFFVGFMVVAVSWVIYYIRHRYKDYARAMLDMSKGEKYG